VDLSQKEHYEKLHEEYKKLMSEYEELAEKEADTSIVNKKLDELTIKHKEINSVFSKMTNKQQ